MLKLSDRERERDIESERGLDSETQNQSHKYSDGVLGKTRGTVVLSRADR